MGCSLNCTLLTLAVIGAVLAIFGGALIPLGNHLVEKTVKRETVIENGTVAYENWVVPGSPVYRQFWIYHVENPNDVMENGSQPILKQKGPYTYRMRYLPKENITHHSDFTVSYFLPNVARFEPEMSVGSENDTMTIVNLAVVAAPALYQSGFIQAMLDIWIRAAQSKFLQNRTVKEILWGYKDPFLMKIPLPGVERVVGVFLPFNETMDGLYRVYTGKEFTNLTAIIHSYKNSSLLPYWGGSCDMVNGTDGASFPPFVKRNEVLQFFSSDICRSIYGIFDSEQVLKDIPLDRFVVPPDAFASPLINPDNICFCTDKVISRNCSSAGALDISSCKQGKPVYITLPHFLYASEDIKQGVEGLHSNKKEHMTFLDVEPTTGFTLRFAKRLQVNLLVKPSTKITPLKKVKQPFLFPVLWLNETAIISDEKAAFFRGKVTNKIKMLHIMEIALIVVGSVMFLGCMASYLIWGTQRLK